MRIFIQYRKWPFPARFLIVWIFFSFIPISAKSAACLLFVDEFGWSKLDGLFQRSAQNTIGSYSVKNETIFIIFWFNRLIELVAISRFIVNNTRDLGTVTLNSSSFSDFLKLYRSLIGHLAYCYLVLLTRFLFWSYCSKTFSFSLTRPEIVNTSPSTGWLTSDPLILPLKDDVCDFNILTKFSIRQTLYILAFLCPKTNLKVILRAYILNKHFIFIVTNLIMKMLICFF